MLGYIKEFTYKDLKIARDAEFIHHQEYSDELLQKGKSVGYVGVEPPDVKFQVESSKGRLVYDQTIRLLDLEEALKQEDIPLRQRVNLAVSGDIAVHCTCPAFKYFYSYVLTHLDSSAGRDENRFPSLRNPKLKGVVCKHLNNVLEALPFWQANIVRDLKALGYE